MAMVMTGEVQLPASREVVWAKLNDAEVLKACIPGCEELNKLSDTEMTAVATTKIGPVKARFKGKVHLTDLDPPNGYKISGEGDGGVAGFAKGGATVALTRKGRRHAAHLQRGGADRRQARPARPAPGQWRRQEDRRRLLQEFRRQCRRRADPPNHRGKAISPLWNPLTRPAPRGSELFLFQGAFGPKSA